MRDELIIAVILITITVVFASVTVIHPNENICNDDFCVIDYYKKFQSDPRFKI
jgi:hypothetical protein